MYSSKSLRTTERRQRPRRRSATIWVSAIVGAAAVTGCFAPSASADARPEAISGDPHSPRVANLATTVLEARAALDANPTAAAEAAYDAALHDLAVATANEMSLSGSQLEAAWRRADAPHLTAVVTALTQLGVPYQSNTSEAFVGFDCSGLTSFAWREAGVQLSRQSGSQISEADERTEETAMAGDIVQYPGHVMLYLGVPDAVVHSSNPEDDVELWLLGDRNVSFGDPSGLAPYVGESIIVPAAASAEAPADVRGALPSASVYVAI